MDMFWNLNWNIFGKKNSIKPIASETKNNTEAHNEGIQNSLYALISDTDKEENQDACGHYYDEKTGTRVMAIADGIGSNKHVAIGSRFVVDKALELIAADLQDNKEIIYTDIFAKIQAELTAMVVGDFADQLDSLNRKDFGTTLIIGVDTPETFTLAYVGNGCVYYMMGDFVKFPEANYLPWSVNNLLIPHSLPDEVTGQDTLCKYFSYLPTLIDQFVPTVITVSKNHHAGEIFIMGTDGVDSLDKHDEFAFSHNELMMTSSWRVSLLCDWIKKTLKSPSELSNDSLHQMLEKYMITLRNENRMDDDTTLGVFVSQKVLNGL